jgi:hypothetical protein
MINNYDKSSTGINIELHVSYDSSLAQFEFNENFTHMANATTRYGSKDVYYYIDNGNIALDDVRDNVELKGDTQAMRSWLKEIRDFNNEEVPGFDTWGRDTLVREVKNELGFLDAMPSLGNYEDLNHEYLDAYNLELYPKDEIERVSIRGYSQGDYAEIIVNVTALKAAWGTEGIDLDSIKWDFTHYFYDSPLCGCIKINDTEYFYDLDRYAFERGDWIDKTVKAYSFLIYGEDSADNDTIKYVRDFLESNIPETPSYD